MPLLPPPDYVPPWPYANPHLHTIVPALCRRVNDIAWRRQRLELADGDFVDLDWLDTAAARAVILCHGLEGSSQTGYMRGMARALGQAGWDVVAFNFRGCSGEPNRLARSYHSGATEDLTAVIDAVRAEERYRTLALTGFSLGGNLVLKYLGERGEDLPQELCGAVAISVPCDLAAGAEQLARPENRLYLWRFLRLLRRKIELKNRRYGTAIPLDGFDRIRDFRAFDDRYTAPLHGFADAAHYWRQCSSRGYLAGIRRPTLLLSALDDPFLAPACFPLDAARDNPQLFLETPRYGGHVGFIRRTSDGRYFSELRAVAFLAYCCPPSLSTSVTKALRSAS